jgi:unspecific monooxygenase
MPYASSPNGFPHTRWRLPVVGDLLTLDPNKVCQGLARELFKHGGIIEQRVFNVSGIVVSRTDLVNEINDEQHWEKQVGYSIRKLRQVAGDGLFTAHSHEPNWAKAHNILMPAFTKASMESYHREMAATVGELIDVWNGRTGSWIEIPAATNRLTAELIGRSGMGHSFNKLSSDTDDPFIAAVIRELTYANRRTDAIPFYEKLFGGRRRDRHQQDKAWLREQVTSIIEDRRRGVLPGAGILDVLLNTVDPDTGESLDDANIANQILTLLVAGSETSANAIAFALHYLATNLDIAAAAHAEIDSRWPRGNLPDFGFGEISRLRYLRRVVEETLRLWPVAPGYFRQARHDTTIGNGEFHFKTGDWVFVLLLGAHRDPAGWGDDADQFRPDRFLPEAVRKLPPRIYKPFGTGPRACIGRQFALHEMMLTLAAVLHQFDLEPDPGYNLEVSEMMTLKPDGLRLRMHRRP